MEKTKPQKMRDYVMLTKFRLSALVIFSAVLGFFIGVDTEWTWTSLAALALGGSLVTAGANGLNQVWEKETDRKMRRTEERPVASGRMTVSEGLLVSLGLGLSGVVVLFLGTNPWTAILSAVALLVYVLVYTPLKRITPLAVFVGAFPGAIPPLLGYVAAHGAVTNEAIMLFALQFIWQFPHFWAIAWRLNEDYERGGFFLLPFSSGRSRENAFQILIYTLALIPMSFIPLWFGYLHPITTGVLVVAALGFAYPAVRLYFSCAMKDATNLMFASFVYLPVMQIAYLLDRFL
jgi:protoheme IX farnesyltransferase